MTYQINWDMDSVFPGGSSSSELRKKMDSLVNQKTAYEEAVQNWNWAEDKPDYIKLAEVLKLQEELSNGLSESMTFTRGLLSADVTDIKAAVLTNELGELASELNSISTVVTKKLVAMPDNEWDELLTKEPFKSVSFALAEQREQGNELLSEKEEALINALSNDGFRGWGDHYNSLVATVTIPFQEKDGSVTHLSAGQAQNQMESHPDTNVRHQVLKDWEEAWSEKTSLFADTLNRLAGFRLANYKAHGVEDYLKRPLEYNRMKKETLDTMWDTITANKGMVKDYLDRKAKLLGLDKLSWSDVEAPLSVGDYTARTYSYNEAARFILENFKKFSGEMASLAETAFEERWIEAEDRPGKRPGGYCANLPESGQSRIFMTFSGSTNEVSTLAHELGHAFHSHVMRDLPALNRRYAMNVAETASTFAEMLISDATVREASDKAEKINLLDSKISRAATMFMNIHARFLFETRFYEERKKGLVSDERLNELMLDAQKEAYKESLNVYHPTFWASKLHFYNTGVPFYNFPYTFGFLFSLGIYARSLEEGKAFEEKYIALLRDTASMTTEELAQKHLGVDLTKPDFWQAAIDTIQTDIQQFMELTEEYI